MQFIQFIYFKKVIKDSFIIPLFILSYYLFFLSLEKCLDGEGICCMKFEWMKKKIIQELFSCLLSIILLELIIFKKISWLHAIHFTFAFIYFYSYSHGINFDDHGLYNIKYYFIILIFFIITLTIIIYILSIKNKKIIFLIILILLNLLYLIQEVIYNFSNCNEWVKGLNKTSLDNNIKKNECKIRIPKHCYYKIGKNFLESIPCTHISHNPRLFIIQKSKSPFINKYSTNLGFPLTNHNDKYLQRMNGISFKKLYLNDVIDMNNLSLFNSLNDIRPEVSVDFSKNQTGIFNVNINYNKSLSEEKKKLEKLTNPYSNNIIILFLDSVSRANSIRQLKKTLKFFERYMPYNGYKNFHSFQFFKYHSHKFFTIGNYPILFYGDRNRENRKRINYYFSKNGFITSLASDACLNDFTESLRNISSDEIYEHEYIMCDPNYINVNSKLKCMYGRLHVEFLFEYINQFWRKYKDNRKFSAILTNFAHENSLERLKFMDKIIYNFFNELYKSHLLKDTSIFLLSDHGVAIPSIYYLNDFFQIEKSLPMLYIFVNDRKNVTYYSQYKYIYENQQTFITGFDIYNTIIHLLYGDQYETNKTVEIISKNGKSLFTMIDSKARSPKNYTPMDLDICI